MNEGSIFWLCSIVITFGILAIGGIIYFGYFVINKRWSDWSVNYVIHFLDKHPEKMSEVSAHVANVHSEFLDKRNQYWSTFGQVIIALVVVIILTILLLTKTISGEAGLPILSAISGFAIAKGSSGAQSLKLPSPPSEFPPTNKG